MIRIPAFQQQGILLMICIINAILLLFYLLFLILQILHCVLICAGFKFKVVKKTHIHIKPNSIYPTPVAPNINFLFHEFNFFVIN